MHMCWGWGFLTSPKSLARRVIASRRPAVLDADAATGTAGRAERDTAAR
jgi:hypothetical protein